MKSLATIAILLGTASAAWAAGDPVKLEYKFAVGDVIRAKITHLSTVDTKIKGVKQTAQMRSISTRRWEVEEIDQDGLITFGHSVENINMWQKVTDRAEISYNSESGEAPPAVYTEAAKSVGVPLAKITVDPQGRLVHRKHLAGTPSNETQILPILPPEPVEPGARWYSNDDLVVQTGSGAQKRIKIRQVFTLEGVRSGVATISTVAQVLTPVTDPMLKVELIQKLTQGKIQFDIEQGCVISQQIDLDETVIGFRGEESVMNYLGRMTEERINDAPAKVASLPAAPKPLIQVPAKKIEAEGVPTPADPATKPVEEVTEEQQTDESKDMEKEERVPEFIPEKTQPGLSLSGPDNEVPTPADPATKPKEAEEPVAELAEVPTPAKPQPK